MHLAWVVAATQTKVNKPGLVIAGVFVVLLLVLALASTRANRRRAKRAKEFAREEHVTGASEAPLPAHTWQSIPNPDLSSLFGLPSHPAGEPPPVLAGLAARLAAHSNALRNTRSTTVANTTLVVFDHLQERPDGKGTERTVCGRFGVDVNCPRLEITANVGFGTFAVGGARNRSFKFEYDDFNQAYSAIGADEKFAFSIVDGEMMRWLLAHPAMRSLHLQGTAAFAVFHPETDADAVFAFVSGFLSRIPPLVQHEWPAT